MSALRLSAAAAVTVAAVTASMLAGSAVGCGDEQEVWVCDNPWTGKADQNFYDSKHFVGGVFDPCHCYDPSGPARTCPILVDAGSDGP
jgi:hypothetical protein